jgi:hypothetical protein
MHRNVVLTTIFTSRKRINEINDEELTENGVGGVHVNLILGRITNMSLSVSEGNTGWRGAVALVIGDDLHTTMLPHTDA